MSSGKLYTYPDSILAKKCQVAAKYGNQNVTLVCKEPEFSFGVTNKTKEFLMKFPLGKVPAFESNDGKCIHSLCTHC